MLFNVALEFPHPFSFYHAAGNLAHFLSSWVCGTLVSISLLSPLVILCIYTLFQQQLLRDPEWRGQILVL